MAESGIRNSIVIPVHSNTGVLEQTLAELRDYRLHAHCTELVFVNDRCPQPGTRELLREFAESHAHVQVLENDRNRGKGYSVARGMLAARGPYRVFTDCDLAYPLTEIRQILKALEDGADVAIACRVHPKSQYEMRSGYIQYIYTRHVASRVFNRLVRALLIPGILDTQAGLKGFTAKAATEVFSRVRIEGFGFDLETLFVSRQLGLRIEQVPVRFRYNDEPSTVRFLRDGQGMMADLARVRWRGWTGEYRVPSVAKT